MQQYFAVSKNNNTLSLNKDDLNHIKNVMRMKEDDLVIVVYNDESFICSLNKNLPAFGSREPRFHILKSQINSLNGIGRYK